MLILACSSEEPVGSDSVQPPGLAGDPSECPDEPYGRVIEEEFEGGHETAAKAQCATILSHFANGRTEQGFKRTDHLCEFERKHGMPPAGEVCIVFMTAPFGLDPEDFPPEAFADGGFIHEFVSHKGGVVLAPNGDFGASFPDGWTDPPGRGVVAFSQPPPCLETTAFTQFEECVNWNTVPGDPPAFKLAATFGHCAFFPDGTDTDGFRLAKELDSPTDPGDGEVVGNIVVLDFVEPPFVLSCSGGPFVPTEPEGVPEIAGVDVSGPAGLLLAGGKHGSAGGPLLAGDRSIGGTASSTSDWGVVDTGDEDITIEGFVRDEGAAVTGAPVNLFCDDEVDGATPASPTAAPQTSGDGGDLGEYRFEADTDGFAPGFECRVEAFKPDIEGSRFGATGPFVVVPGPNEQDIEMGSGID